ncbi:hypothetical protein AB1E18_009497 [Capra hircus]
MGKPREPTARIRPYTRLSFPSKEGGSARELSKESSFRFESSAKHFPFRLCVGALKGREPGREGEDGSTSGGPPQRGVAFRSAAAAAVVAAATTRGGAGGCKSPPYKYPNVYLQRWKRKIKTIICRKALPFQRSKVSVKSLGPLISTAVEPLQYIELHRDSAGASESRTGTGRLCASRRKNN